ncbi:hypothetical protein OG225_05090 [Nocardia sp. NBC_01377]|uniref:DUF1156 domain-containing protein n=1 Tax=Nocardia sp. NBC_01377 TaxID=2903595 RepID=UPI00324AD4C6
MRSTAGDPPTILDPFAGGGAIPLEAQRLGLKAEASDLNPVAVLINKALIEIPSVHRDQAPIYPGLAASEFRSWTGTEGIAADVRAYGAWMRDEAEAKIGSLYPMATHPDGTPARVIAWIWARTVTCPNPACGIQMPLVRSWWLGKKPGKEAYVVPSVVSDSSTSSGLRVKFEIGHGKANAPTATDDGTVSGRTGAVCLACRGHAPVDYLRAEGKACRGGQQLMAVVIEGNRRRVYVAPDGNQEAAARVGKPEESIAGEIADNPRWFSPPAYGLTDFSDLFTDRQLTALTTFSDLVASVHAKAIADKADPAYATAIATYLGFAVSRLSSTNSTICRWNSAPSKESVSDTFSRQALPMVWDYAEGNPFYPGPPELAWSVGWVARALEWLPAGGGRVEQADAASRSFENVLIATDPPYYDNIGYSDLSDYFYVWLRRSLRCYYPDLLSTMLVPKAEELVANPYRHGGRAGAEDFFESGFRRVFANARSTATSDHPITVWYAFKQSESDSAGEASTGWETLLEGMIRSGWEITSTWPMRSERNGRMISVGTNALASAIVLSLRPRASNAATTDRRGFIAVLESELPRALRRLQHGQIAPVDLPQAAIGPGMAVFSRFGAVLEPNGDKMTVRSALARINEILDQVLNEQEGDFDSKSRFAIAWYRQHGYGVGKFGDADSLARARNTSVDTMDRDEILTSRAGHVQLIKPFDLSWDYDVLKDMHTSNWEALHHLIKVLERDGIAPAGDFLQASLTRADGAIDADLVKELAHLLFRIAEANGWTKDALSFNTLVTSWPEILEVARSVKTPAADQSAFDFEEEDD